MSLIKEVIFLHRAKEFLHHSAEHILDCMEEHDDKMTKETVAYVAELCCRHNEICEFLEYVQKHRDGSLYDGMTKDSVFGGMKKKF